VNTLWKSELVTRPASRYAREKAMPWWIDRFPREINPDDKPELKRVYVPLEDAKLERLLEASAPTGRSLEEVIQERASP
jgi:hypothetical protein